MTTRPLLVTDDMLRASAERLVVSHGTMQSTAHTRALLDAIGGTPALVRICDAFYARFFRDPDLDQFVASHEPPHGERLALWIAQKMGAGPVWTDSRPRDARQLAHWAAWNCPKRALELQGRRFKVEDCRRWMRLMFWSAREETAATHPDFFVWFVLFLRHFVAVYERSAPAFALEAANWSADPRNTADYVAAGRMVDVTPRRQSI
eukprot:Rhum_TRINITY_DN5412_c0_g1::Rhum_TRINITY_DN5412_c0_g1_i1::g.17357::m.17357